MAKKGFGKFVAFAAVAGAVAAGVSYIFQYKTFHKELEKDFREFEEDGEDDSLKKDPQEKTGQDDSSGADCRRAGWPGNRKSAKGSPQGKPKLHFPCIQPR